MFTEFAEMINRRRMNKILRYMGREVLVGEERKFVREVYVKHTYKGLNRNKKVVTDWLVDVAVSDTIDSVPYHCKPTTIKIIKQKFMRKVIADEELAQKESSYVR